MTSDWVVKREDETHKNWFMYQGLANNMNALQRIFSAVPVCTCFEQVLRMMPWTRRQLETLGFHVAAFM